VVLPTGSGKTDVAIAAMARCNVPALVIVPTRVLLGQWIERLARAYDGPVGAYGDRERRVCPVTVCTAESAYRHMSHLGRRFRLLVIDEVHHFGRGGRDEALEMSLAPYRLGLTATPPGGDAALALAELVGPTVYQLGIRDLAGRHLADFDHVVMLLGLSPEERAEYDRCRAEYLPLCRDYFARCPLATWADFTRAARRTEVGRRALHRHSQARQIVSFTAAKARALAALLERHRQRRTLIFTADNHAAYAIARDLLVMPITCDIDRAERAAALAQFQRGELRALVSARVLNEGVDVPDADVGIIVGGTQGEREHVQRVGRLLRPSPGKRATIYELVSAGTHEVRTAAERRRGLDA
jgi:superfamily II DNA or RNA helicase